MSDRTCVINVFSDMSYQWPFGHVLSYMYFGACLINVLSDMSYHTCTLAHYSTRNRGAPGAELARTAADRHGRQPPARSSDAARRSRSPAPTRRSSGPALGELAGRSRSPAPTRRSSGPAIAQSPVGACTSIAAALAELTDRWAARRPAALGARLSIRTGHGRSRSPAPTRRSSGPAGRRRRSSGLDPAIARSPVGGSPGRRARSDRRRSPRPPGRRARSARTRSPASRSPSRQRSPVLMDSRRRPAIGSPGQDRPPAPAWAEGAVVRCLGTGGRRSAPLAPCAARRRARRSPAPP